MEHFTFIQPNPLNLDVVLSATEFLHNWLETKNLIFLFSNKLAECSTYFVSLQVRRVCYLP